VESRFYIRFESVALFGEKLVQVGQASACLLLISANPAKVKTRQTESLSYIISSSHIRTIPYSPSIQILTFSLGAPLYTERGKFMLRLVLIVLLVLILLGALPSWPYSASWGYYPSGGAGLLLIIVVLLIFLEVI
jgi:hypothetical protein